MHILWDETIDCPWHSVKQMGTEDSKIDKQDSGFIN